MQFYCGMRQGAVATCRHAFHTANSRLMADTQRKIGPPFSAIAILLRILVKTIEHTDLKPSQSCLYCLKSFESTVGAGYSRVRFIVDRCHPPSRHYFPQVPNVRTTEVAQPPCPLGFHPSAMTDPAGAGILMLT